LATVSQHDSITLAGVRLRPRIGVTPGERRLPQPCQADVTIWGDFEPAASTDALDKASDYCRILATVLETAHGREYNLLEALTYRIARAVLQAFPAKRVRVRVRKRPAVLLESLDFIEVEVEES
jgi:dihydroneopterin aldolase